MSRLAIHSVQGQASGEVLDDHAAISLRLHDIGVRFERWLAIQPLASDATQEAVLAAYQAQVERLGKEYGFRSVDVVSLRPDHPRRDELRATFLAEHTHADFEMRFFVEGRGLFYLHVGELVYLVLCEQGDLISVPANVSHWFDMGRAPDFKCIRFFVIPEGWVAQFSGSEIARRFPDFDQFVSRP